MAGCSVVASLAGHLRANLQLEKNGEIMNLREKEKVERGEGRREGERDGKGE